MAFPCLDFCHFITKEEVRAFIRERQEKVRAGQEEVRAYIQKEQEKADERLEEFWKKMDRYL